VRRGGGVGRAVAVARGLGVGGHLPVHGIGVAVTVGVGVEVAVGVGGGVNVICAAALILAGQATQGQQVTGQLVAARIPQAANSRVSRVTRHFDARGEVAESGATSASVQALASV
jgi:hypothetical protein